MKATAGDVPRLRPREIGAWPLGSALALAALAITAPWSLSGCHGTGGLPTPRPPLSWSPASTAGGSPTARDGHSMVLDVASDRAIVFGGEQQPGNPPALSNDVWVLSNATGTASTASVWSQLAPAGVAPSRRAFHAAAYDRATNRMIVFGGNPNVGFCHGALNDVWILDDANALSGSPAWLQVTPTGTPPGSRASPTAVFDAAANELIVFGGVDPCGATYSDVWILSSANGVSGTPSWTQLLPGGPPIPGRFDHISVHDEANDRLIVFGGLVGSSQSGASPGNDVWVLANANGTGGAPAWIQLSPAGTPPSARYGMSAVYDSPTNRLVIFAGVPSSAAQADLWILSNANGLGGTATWSQLSPKGTPPSTRASSAAVFMNERLTIFGGQDGSGASRSDLFRVTGL